MNRPKNTGKARSPLSTYLLLLVLLAASFGVAQFRWGGYAWIFGIAIAFVKIGAIATDFMEVRSSDPVVRVAAAVGVVWFAFLLGLTFPDYFGRNDRISPSAWPPTRSRRSTLRSR